MPSEETTYRAGVQQSLGTINERMLLFEKNTSESLQRIENSQEKTNKKLDFTNGKVRKIIMALILLAGIIIGQSFSNTHDIISLLSHAL